MRDPIDFFASFSGSAIHPRRAARRFVLLRRQVAIDWQEETLPPLEFKVRFAVAEGK